VPIQTQEMICGGRYLSSDDPLRTFAAGSLTNELRIEVLWRSGKQSLVKAARANHIYEIEEDDATAPEAAVEKKFAEADTLGQVLTREGFRALTTGSGGR